jgi:hypothetical protein
VCVLCVCAVIVFCDVFGVSRQRVRPFHVVSNAFLHATDIAIPRPHPLLKLEISPHPALF